MPELKPASGRDAELIDRALSSLRDARIDLVEAGASKRTVDRVRAAMKSVEGAKRHMSTRLNRAYAGA